MKFRRSFYRNGVTENEAYEVIAYDLWFEMRSSPRGNPQVMFVGFNCAGVCLEIGVEITAEEADDIAFHARKATRVSKENVGILQ